VTIEIIQAGGGLIVLDGNPQTAVIVQDAAAQIVNIVGQGPQGPQGPAGAPGPQGPAGDTNALGGVPVQFSGLAADDLLAYSGSAWINRPQTQITDAGNF
jgi:hypothetical protein